MDYRSDLASGGGPPLTVQDIAEKALDFEYNPLIPLRYWLRTADTILKEANIYEREGNEQQTYLLLLRHAELLLKYLPDHPQASLPENKKNLRMIREHLNEDVKRLEYLKPRIIARYEAYEKALREREARRLTLGTTRSSAPPGSQQQYVAYSPRSSYSSNRQDTSGDTQQVALELARQEFARREKEKLTRGSSTSKDGERRRHSEEYDLQKHMQSLNIQASELHGEYDRRVSSSRGSERNRRDRDSGGGGTARGWVYEYPTVPKQSTKQSTRSSFSPAPLPHTSTSTSTSTSISTIITRSPLFVKKANPSPPPKLPTELTDPQPLKRSRTTSNYEFKTSARLENGQRLRTIFLPANLRHKFLEIAYPNTKRNLETCGVLCGTLIQNALFITRLVVPEQEVTSDTCDMKDEEELFKYVDGEDLMVLGWIHTHPMYECFMSSVDLHNHCGYQLMLPESIAVVCAPRYEPSWGVFRLTDPPGVKTIMTCTQKSLFHPHEAGGLYTDAMRPGHVVVVNEMEFEVIDLRK
ncbi:hypothetical protein BGX38DRAFT_1095162 [Terfezia claveryi]|nr:hypothetical protein BGX38DRAFT_1095162 [Terfezia claveryi]